MQQCCYQLLGFRASLYFPVLTNTAFNCRALHHKRPNPIKHNQQQNILIWRMKTNQLDMQHANLTAGSVFTKLHLLLDWGGE